MRILATATALLCALLALPALASGRPSEPFDFELAARSGDPVAAGGPAAPRVLETPRPFNLVGLRWRGPRAPAIRLRARRPDGAWSRWQRLDAHSDHNPDPRRGGEPVVSSSDPLWVGSADALQYRLSRPVKGLRLHFVNVASELRAARAAQDPEPTFVSRRQWGASKCPPREAPDYGTVKAVHVHHTVSLNDYAPEEGPAIVLSVCRYHRNSNGWNDVGYNALVDKYGVLYEGRAGGLDQAVVGAQAQGFNDETAGIASIGDHTSVEATPETLSALATYIRWKLSVHGQPLSGPVTMSSSGGSATKYPAGRRVTLERVIGHRDTGRTACPGALLYAQLDELRALVASGVGLLPTFATRLSGTLADFFDRLRRRGPRNRTAVGARRRPAGQRDRRGPDQRHRTLEDLLAHHHGSRRHLRRRAEAAAAPLCSPALPGPRGAAPGHLGTVAAAPAPAGHPALAYQLLRAG